jgi:hypothetical protein
MSTVTLRIFNSLAHILSSKFFNVLEAEQYLIGRMAAYYILSRRQ